MTQTKDEFKMKLLLKSQEVHCREVAKEKGKCYGECESCGAETVLVEEIGMCGVCTFGSAEYINGNW